MQTITATVPVTLPPSWAAQQRLLLATMSDSISSFLDRYTHDDGELIYDDAWGGGADDFDFGVRLQGGRDQAAHGQAVVHDQDFDAIGHQAAPRR